MTLPELYLLGAPKAATTSISNWLAGHPDVYWSVPKEPYYWAADYPRMRAHYGFDTRAAYESLYASAEAQAAKIRGDGSTTYLYSRLAVTNIREAVPSARFMVCLRNPVDLLVSYHRTQIVALNEDEHDFGKAWRRNRAGGLPGTDPLDTKLVDYALVGGLGGAVERLLQTVSRDRVHFVVFDDVVTQPQEVWRSLASFVGIDPRLISSLAADNASNTMFRSQVLRRLTHRPPRVLEPTIRRLRQWSRATHIPGVDKVKRYMWRSEARPSASPEDRREVAAFFKEDVGRLSDLLGRSLSGWAD